MKSSLCNWITRVIADTAKPKINNHILEIRICTFSTLPHKKNTNIKHTNNPPPPTPTPQKKKKKKTTKKQNEEEK